MGNTDDRKNVVPSSDPLRSTLFDGDEEEWEGQLQAWTLIYGYMSSMALKAACVLGIPDILAREGRGASLTLHEIASRLGSSSPNTEHLYRILRFLCAKGVFSMAIVEDPSGAPQPRYGLTRVSKCFVTEKNPTSLTPSCLWSTDKVYQTSYQHLSDYVVGGGVPFEEAHEGMDFWSFSKKNPDFQKLFNAGMAGNSSNLMKSFLKHYRGFGNLGTVVDVGGGIGMSASRIAGQYPCIKAINYDLPHVVATAPIYPGVEHIGGDMFKSIPAADAVFIKWVLHNWDDEDCIKILSNCRKALPETGKVIIVEIVLEADACKEKGPFSDLGLVMDLVMVANFPGAKERTREQWKALLTAAQFAKYNFIQLPDQFISIIEAFPVASPPPANLKPVCLSKT